jgi:hypothetical protein
MPKIPSRSGDKGDNDVSTILAPFLHHGLVLASRPGTRHVYGECPFCGKHQNKFSVAAETGQFDCKRCGTAGNQYDFIRKLHALAVESTTDHDLEKLADERNIAPDTLRAWGVAMSPLTGEWMVPGHDIAGKLDQLYRYAEFHNGGQVGQVKRRLIPTPGLWKDGNTHRLFGIPTCLEVKKAHTIYVCEGPWDGMALWEVLGQTRETGGELVPTPSVKSSMRARAAVVATPGANVFLEQWLPLFRGKDVVVLFDNDHPRKNPQGAQIPGAGLSGVKRVTGLLRTVNVNPRVLFWGNDADPPTQHDPGTPSGTDVRDLINDAGPVPAVTWILSHLIPAPADWHSSSQDRNGRKGKKDGLTPLPCESYATLVAAWKRAMRWTDGLDRGLVFSLAIIVSTDLVSESQIWGILESPASTGKTTLADGMTIAEEYVKDVTNLTGLYSGYKTDKDGDVDHSLIAQLAGKTMIIKEADAILQNPMRDTILSQLRAMYDRRTTSNYKNGINRKYDDNCTVLMCGTGSVKTLDSSELGSRYLTCSIMRGIDHELELEVLDRVIQRTLANAKLSSNCASESRMSEEMATAKRLTGGYVIHLRKNANRLINSVMVRPDDATACRAYGMFVSYMRARRSKHQDEIAEREFGARLTEQHLRLAMCMAAVVGKTRVDREIMGRVRQVAVDTAQGKTFKLATYMFRQGRSVGVPEKSMVAWMGMTPVKVLDLIGYLREIKVIERFKYSGRGVVDHHRWRLTETTGEEEGGDD